MARKTYRKGITIFLLVMFICHFSIIIVFLSETVPTNSTADRAIRAYINPVFFQNWKVFAPEPPTWKEKMYVSYKSANLWSDWQDPGESLLRKHHMYRVTYHGVLYNIYKNIACDILYQYEQLSNDAEELGLSGKEKQQYVDQRIITMPIYNTAQKVLCVRRAIQLG